MYYSFRSFSLLLLALLLASACKQSGLRGFTETKEGLLYKHHIKNKGAKPQAGDRMDYHLYFRNADSIVATSREQKVPIRLKMPDGMEDNLLLQSLARMSQGDSLTMVRERDSIRMPLPPGYETGDLVFIDVVLLNLKPAAEVAAEKKTLLEGYTRSEDGFYYKRHNKSSGKTPKGGDGVAFDFNIKKGDLVVFSTTENGQPTRHVFPEEETHDHHDHHGHDHGHHHHDHGGKHNDNPILEMLTTMGEQDSVTLIMEADSMARELNPEWTFQPGDLVTFELKLQDIKTKAELEEEQRAYERNANKLSKQAQKAIKAYKRGDLIVKTTGSGLKYHVLEEGTGVVPQQNDGVAVNYSGHLMNGKQFDNSFKRGQPFGFPLGQGRVIPGWDEGLALLKEGTKAYLVIPAELAYGERGMLPDIPANSDLFFYVELKEVFKNK